MLRHGPGRPPAPSGAFTTASAQYTRTGDGRRGSERSAPPGCFDARTGPANNKPNPPAR